MRIAIINDMLWGGGRERRIVQLLKGLVEAGYTDVHLILLDGRIDYPEVMGIGIKVIVIKRKRKDLSVFSKLTAVLREIRPDVVNAWSYLSSVYAGCVSARLGLPFVSAMIADCNPPKFSSLEYVAKRITFLLARKIVANTKSAHEVYRTPSTKRVVIYNGFDDSRRLKLKKKAELLSEFGVAADVPVVTMAARFEKEKDFETFVKACREVHARGRRFVAFCIGQGSLMSSIDDALTDAEREFIKLPGFRQDVESFMAGSDVGVLCTDTRHHQEGISNSLLEFMAFGKPVIATRCLGTEELVIHNVNGLLVEPWDSVELADRIESLLSAPTRRLEMGRSAAAIVQEQFSLVRMTCEFIDLYEAATRER